MSTLSPDHTTNTAKFYAKSLYDSAFKEPNLPRSLEYKQGTLTALLFRASGQPINNPYRLGTSSSDAFLSGLDQGFSIWKEQRA